MKYTRKVLLGMTAAAALTVPFGTVKAHATAGRCDPIRGGYLHCFTVEGKGHRVDWTITKLGNNIGYPFWARSYVQWYNNGKAIETHYGNPSTSAVHQDRHHRGATYPNIHRICSYWRYRDRDRKEYVTPVICIRLTG
jgi:hypothetical protein